MYKTYIAINGWPMPDESRRRKVLDIFSGEEIDRLSKADFIGKTPEELSAIEQKLEDTSLELEPSDIYRPGSPEWQLREERFDKIEELLLDIQELLEEYDADDDEDADEDEDEDENPAGNG